MPRTLIEPALLAAHLGDPDWAVIDCRFDLARPAWGEAAFAQGHIPGAQYAHLERDLSGRVRADTGRHPLPEVADLAATLGRLGIDPAVQVVACDQDTGAFAARLWWLLRWLGHAQVAVLDGGLAAWQRAGLAFEVARAARPSRRFTPAPDESRVIGSAGIEAALAAGALAHGQTLLVDARSAERFAGRNETIDPVAGHIPGARSQPFAANLDAQGRFLPAAQLRARWAPTLAGRSGDAVIAMCGSGVTACHDLLALEVMGLSGARLYAGSWSEWIRDPGRPIAPGAENL